MSIHFNTAAEAIAHLNSKGFRQIKNGNYVNSVCAAHILTIQNSDAVCVQVWETPR